MNRGADFEKSLAFVLSVESGYTDDPVDHGGSTNKGITQREYTEWLRVNHLPRRKVVDILNADVREIYWSEYWLGGRCDRMPWPLCLAHFDACVNLGVGQAAKFLQRALDVKDDGAIGPRKFVKGFSGRFAAVCFAVGPQPLGNNLLRICAECLEQFFVQGWV